MPIHKAGSGYQWGNHGKVYRGPGARAKAARQAAAAHANGYRGHDEGGSPVNALTVPAKRPGRIKGCELFRAGVQRGKEYTTRDLDDMVENFRRAQSGPRPAMRVPLVLGHEEDQSYLRRSDLPAAGWLSRLYRQGDTLKGDFEHVPPQVARLLNGKAYRKVSAEIYDEPPDGLPGRGKVMRRVAALGGDIPQVKSLADIPAVEFSERFAPPAPTLLQFSEVVPLPNGCFAVFSEIKPMNREEMIQKLGEHGVDTSMLTEAVPDELLAEMLRVCEDKDAQKGEQEEGQAPPEGEDLPEGGEGQEGREYDERGEEYEDKGSAPTTPLPGPASGAEMVDGPDNADRPRNASGRQAAARMHDSRAPAAAPMRPKAISHTYRFSEEELSAAVERALAGKVGRQLERLQKFSERQERAARKAAAAAEVDLLVQAGKVPPAERRHEIELLMELDHTTVRKFSEGGKTFELSAHDRHLHSLRARPSLFAEKFRDPHRAGASEDAEAAKVEAHWESFAEDLRKVNVTKEALVKGFKSARKHQPDLTAEKYLAA